MALQDHTDCNTSTNEHFQDVLKTGLASPQRRMILRGGLGLAAASSLPMMGGLSSPAYAATAPGLPSLGASPIALGFAATGKSLADAVTVPSGYTVRVVHATGDRFDASVAAYSNTGAETDDWSKRIGDHHDGMTLFYVDAAGKFSATATNRAVLAVNHESSADSHFWHANGQTSGGVSGKKFDQFGSWDVKVRPGLEVLKEINHHGVSVVELSADAQGIFSTVKAGSPLNRRITAQTVMKVQGPATHISDIQALLVTAFDTTGATCRGTLNNCANGRTPWGTYLTCEENWNVYTNIPTGGVAPQPKLVAGRKRYGVASTPIGASATVASGQGWYTPTDLPDTDFRFSRWNTSASGATAANDFRNEPHTFGYVVEIDPLAPSSAPAKRVALGRFAHENAACSVPVAGKPLAIYMGCDSRNEYIYKFVSQRNWDAADVGGGMAAGDKYLNEGKLYVAKFNADGSGEWIELSISDSRIASYNKDGFTFSNQAEVLVFSRLAADAVGATKMDRPEWAAVNPVNGEVYFTLTNNSAANRTPASTDAANPRSYNDPDGKKGSGNPNGHIIRFKESTPAATGFSWDIFLFGAEQNSAASVNISGLGAGNDFSSPDGLWFSEATPGLLWIQTDDGAYTDMTNCMLLAATPGTVGDGGKFTVANSLSAGGNTTTGNQNTFVGGLLGDARLRRFLVGPKGAEITGVAESADGKALYVNIQHPGENTKASATDGWIADAAKLESQWPTNGAGLPAAYGPGKRPRSATIVISRNDGGKVGV
ncbi:MAG: PhoX family phosphatase [Betaproteobacteria bacterium]